MTTINQKEMQAYCKACKEQIERCSSKFRKNVPKAIIEAMEPLLERAFATDCDTAVFEYLTDANFDIPDDASLSMYANNVPDCLYLCYDTNQARQIVSAFVCALRSRDPVAVSDGFLRYMKDRDLLDRATEASFTPKQNSSFPSANKFVEGLDQAKKNLSTMELTNGLSIQGGKLKIEKPRFADENGNFVGPCNGNDRKNAEQFESSKESIAIKSVATEKKRTYQEELASEMSHYKSEKINEFKKKDDASNSEKECIASEELELVKAEVKETRAALEAMKASREIEMTKASQDAMEEIRALREEMRLMRESMKAEVQDLKKESSIKEKEKEELKQALEKSKVELDTVKSTVESLMRSYETSSRSAYSREKTGSASVDTEENHSLKEREDKDTSVKKSIQVKKTLGITTDITSTDVRESDCTSTEVRVSDETDGTSTEIRESDETDGTSTETRKNDEITSEEKETDGTRTEINESDENSREVKERNENKETDKLSTEVKDIDVMSIEVKGTVSSADKNSRKTEVAKNVMQENKTSIKPKRKAIYESAEAIAKRKQRDAALSKLHGAEREEFLANEEKALLERKREREMEREQKKAAERLKKEEVMMAEKKKYEEIQARNIASFQALCEKGIKDDKTRNPNVNKQDAVGNKTIVEKKLQVIKLNENSGNFFDFKSGETDEGRETYAKIKNTRGYGGGKMRRYERNLVSNDSGSRGEGDEGYEREGVEERDEQYNESIQKNDTESMMSFNSSCAEEDETTQSSNKKKETSEENSEETSEEGKSEEDKSEEGERKIKKQDKNEVSCTGTVEEEGEAPNLHKRMAVEHRKARAAMQLQVDEEISDENIKRICNEYVNPPINDRKTYEKYCTAWENYNDPEEKMSETESEILLYRHTIHSYEIDYMYPARVAGVNRKKGIKKLKRNKMEIDHDRMKVLVAENKKCPPSKHEQRLITNNGKVKKRAKYLLTVAECLLEHRNPGNIKRLYRLRSKKGVEFGYTYRYIATDEFEEFEDSENLIHYITTIYPYLGGSRTEYRDIIEKMLNCRGNYKIVRDSIVEYEKILAQEMVWEGYSADLCRDMGLGQKTSKKWDPLPRTDKEGNFGPYLHIVKRKSDILDFKGCMTGEEMIEAARRESGEISPLILAGLIRDRHQRAQACYENYRRVIETTAFNDNQAAYGNPTARASRRYRAKEERLKVAAGKFRFALESYNALSTIRQQFIYFPPEEYDEIHETSRRHKKEIEILEAHWNYLTGLRDSTYRTKEEKAYYIQKYKGWTKEYQKYISVCNRITDEVMKKINEAVKPYGVKVPRLTQVKPELEEESQSSCDEFRAMYAPEGKIHPKYLDKMERERERKKLDDADMLIYKFSLSPTMDKIGRSNGREALKRMLEREKAWQLEEGPKEAMKREKKRQIQEKYEENLDLIDVKKTQIKQLKEEVRLLKKEVEKVDIAQHSIRIVKHRKEKTYTEEKVKSVQQLTKEYNTYLTHWNKERDLECRRGYYEEREYLEMKNELEEEYKEFIKMDAEMQDEYILSLRETPWLENLNKAANYMKDMCRRPSVHHGELWGVARRLLQSVMDLKYIASTEQVLKLPVYESDVNRPLVPVTEITALSSKTLSEAFMKHAANKKRNAERLKKEGPPEPLY